MYGVYIKCIKFEEYVVEIERDGEKRQYEVKGRQGLFNVLPEKTLPFKLHLSFVEKNLSCDHICDYIENSGLREIKLDHGMIMSGGFFNNLCNCKYFRSFIDLTSIYLDEDIYKIFKNKNISTFQIYTANNSTKSDLINILLDTNEERRKQARKLAITAFLCLKPILGKDLSRKIAEMVYYDY